MSEQLEVRVDEYPIHFTVSVCSSTWQEYDAGIDSILKLADQALYMAKKIGLTTVEII